MPVRKHLAPRQQAKEPPAKSEFIFERTLKALGANPERYSLAADLPGVQKLRIEQFPFSLLYINRPDYVWVVAIAHASRKPGYWKNRIS